MTLAEHNAALISSIYDAAGETLQVRESCVLSAVFHSGPLAPNALQVSESCVLSAVFHSGPRALNAACKHEPHAANQACAPCAACHGCL